MALVRAALRRSGRVDRSRDGRRWISSTIRSTWDHDDPTILMARGHESALLAGVFERLLVPALGDDPAARLHERRAGARVAAPGRLGDPRRP
jgi:hypothetical protein